MTGGVEIASGTSCPRNDTVDDSVSCNDREVFSLGSMLLWPVSLGFGFIINGVNFGVTDLPSSLLSYHFRVFIASDAGTIGGVTSFGLSAFCALGRVA